MVLTAHPSENKRRTILAKYEEIHALLELYSSNKLSDVKKQITRDQLKAQITAIWMTERSRTLRPTLNDEMRSGLYFVENTFWNVFPQLYMDLNTALIRFLFQYGFF